MTELGSTRLRGRRRRWLWPRVATILLLLLVVAALIPHVRYELTHDLPNPYWGTFWLSYSYTPQQGPPGPSLVETRPDDIALQFIRDYVNVAGTFPCVTPLASYREDSDAGDPVLDESGKPCDVHRPIREIHITLVYVRAAFQALRSTPEATVQYRITYMDGEQLSSAFLMIPDTHRSHPYYLTYIRANCWFLSKASLNFYTHAGREPPRGLQYFTFTDSKRHCAGFA